MKAKTVLNKSVMKTRAERAKERMPRWVMPAARALVVVMDAIITAFSFIAAFILRDGNSVLSATAWAWSKSFVPYAGILYFAVVIRVAMLIYMRAYKFQGAFSYTKEFSKVLKAVAVGSLLMIAWTFLFRGGFAFRNFSYSRSLFFIDFAIVLTLISAFHLGIRVIQTMIRERGINLIPTLVAGTNAEAVQTLNMLRDRRGLGYKVIGVVECGSEVDPEFAASNTDIIGHIDELPQLIRDLAIQEVIITDDSLPSSTMFEAMLQAGRDQRVEFRFAPSLFNLLPQKTSVEQIGVLPMVRLFREPLSDAQRFVKRTFDVFAASLAIIISAPVWLVIAVLIRRDSTGPILFRQERVGMDGRVFLCYKFRTMAADSGEELHKEIYKQNIIGDSKANCGDTDEPLFGKVKNDPRVTRFGAKLRRTSLDELPQLLNVLVGDMSFVGPRPPIPYEVEEYAIHHRKRLDMKPGITGLWQVSGRSRIGFEQMVALDLFYIENWSFWLDLKIIAMTFPAILRGDGAR